MPNQNREITDGRAHQMPMGLRASAHPQGALISARDENEERIAVVYEHGDTPPEITITQTAGNIQTILANGIAVAIVACAVLTWRTGIAAIAYFDRGDMMARIWRIPRIYPYVVIPFGCALLTIGFAFRLGLYLQSADPEADLKARAARGQDTGEGDEQ